MPLRIESLTVGEDATFRSSVDNELTATVVVSSTADSSTNGSESESEIVRIAFVGWLQSVGNAGFYYEFLHEEVYVYPGGGASQTVSVPVWLPRFPPSFSNERMAVCYACRATVTDWHVNAYVEQPFSVLRELRIQPDDPACYQFVQTENDTVGGGCCGGRPTEVYARLSLPKRAFTNGEVIPIDADITTNPPIEIDKIKAELVQTISFRKPNRSKVMDMQRQVQSILVHSQKSPGTQFSMVVPNNAPATMQMSIWNVMSVLYELRFEVKARQGDPVTVSVPVVITSMAVQGIAAPEVLEEKQDVNRPPTILARNAKRSRDVDDESDDDDDNDTDDEEHEDDPYTVTKFDIVVHTEDSLSHAYASVVVNVNKPMPIEGVRLLFIGECNVKSGAGTGWYEFLRYKALISTGVSMAKGEHHFTVPLPFDADEEYDVARMPPTWDDRKATIRYMCRVSTKPWIRNQYQERMFKFSRVQNDSDDPAMMDPYRATTGETIGRDGDVFCTVHLPRRVFMRGTDIPVSVRAQSQTADIKKVEASLQQYCEFRQPKLNNYQVSQFDESVAHAENSEKPLAQNLKLHIPADVSPNIHWCYWNVVNVWYELVVSVHSNSGVHRHVVPIDISTSGDRQQLDYDPIDHDPDFVPVPVQTHSQRQPVHHRDIDTPRDAFNDDEERPDSGSGFYGTENYIEPEWVGRLNHHTYKH